MFGNHQIESDSDNSDIRTFIIQHSQCRFTRNVSDASRFCYSAPMITRVIVLVIDGLGVGAMPDAAEYGDAGSNTLSHLADAVGGLNLPTLEALGLGHITEIKGVRTMGQPEGCFGRLGFLSKGVDSMVRLLGNGRPSDGRCRAAVSQRISS